MIIKVYLPILFSIFSFKICFAQQSAENKADSITQIIESANVIKDIEKVKSELIELANVYEHSGSWDLHKEVVDEMLKLAHKTSDKVYEAEVYNILGISNCLGGRNQVALDYFSKALAINSELNDTLSISNSYENIGRVYKDLADYDKAIIYQMKSLKIRENCNHPRLVNNYTALATVYQKLQDTINHFQYLNKAKIAISKHDNPDNFQMAIIHNEIAGYYNTLNDMDSALVNYKLVAYYSEKGNWKRGMAVGYGNMAEVYFTYGEIDKAIEMHRKVLKLSIEIDDCMGIAEEFIYLSNLYNEMGKIDSALILANKSLQKADECGLDHEKLSAYEFISEIYENINKPALALEFYKLFHVLNDSIYNLEKHNSITEIETQYETEKKEQQISLLSAENKIKNQRIRLGLAVISVLVLLVIMIFFLMRMRKKNAQIAQDDLKQKLFRSQMNPHFIFNALGSIQNYMYKNETKKAAQFLGNFASLSRSILKYSSEESISLEEEIETLTNYLELEQMRMKNAFAYEFIIDQDLETEFINIPPMMIQPFIENAVKHGLKEVEKDGKITIEISDKVDVLEVTILDNGIGFGNSQQNKDGNHESMATQIFNERMRHLKKKNKHIPDLSIQNISEDENTGTKIHLFLPIIK
ncbi:MAG: tetratricopeptide repeat protein [Bacteroidales bacterium]|nr:tetratricopeptide repeat protein [Bacteroidales bacterium]